MCLIYELQGEEDRKLQEDLEMLVQRLSVSYDNCLHLCLLLCSASCQLDMAERAFRNFVSGGASISTFQMTL